MSQVVDQEVPVHQHKHLQDDAANINVIELVKRASAASVRKLSNFIKGLKILSLLYLRITLILFWEKCNSD